jgi:hypothetical protein
LFSWCFQLLFIFGYEGIGYLIYVALFLTTVFGNRPGEDEFFMNQNLQRLFAERELPFKDSPFPKRWKDTNEFPSM